MGYQGGILRGANVLDYEGTAPSGKLQGEEPGVGSHFGGCKNLRADNKSVCVGVYDCIICMGITWRPGNRVEQMYNGANTTQNKTKVSCSKEPSKSICHHSWLVARACAVAPSRSSGLLQTP